MAWTYACIGSTYFLVFDTLINTCYAKCHDCVGLTPCLVEKSHREGMDSTLLDILKPQLVLNFFFWNYWQLVLPGLRKLERASRESFCNFSYPS